MKRVVLQTDWWTTHNSRGTAGEPVVIVVIFLVLLHFDPEEDSQGDGGGSEASDGEAREEGSSQTQCDVGIGEGTYRDGGEGREGIVARGGDHEEAAILLVFVQILV